MQRKKVFFDQQPSEQNNTAEQSDKLQLFIHKNHPYTVNLLNRDIAQGFFVIFIVKTEFQNLNFCETKWLCILNAKIYINKMILPRIQRSIISHCVLMFFTTLSLVYNQPAF